MSTLAVERRLTELWETPKSVYGWFSSVDHKDLGIRYLVTAFVFLLVGGIEALLMRIQLTHSIGQCAEYCGEQHAHMHILVVAQEPAEFEAWLANQRKPGVQPTNAERLMGEQAFLAGPCVRCHTIRGTVARAKVGPDLTHIGSRMYIGANSFQNNNAYLEAWVTVLRNR